MTIFSVGPVEMYPRTRQILGTQEPYFRTPEFSEEVLAIRDAFLACVHAPHDAAFALLTASGTGAMEAAVRNILAPGDAALVVNAGSFGARFVELCERAGANVTEITLPFLEGDLTEDALEAAFARASESGAAPKALFVQACETSSGRAFNLEALGRFTAEHGLLFVVDAVSAFLCDAIDMRAQHIDLVLTASQKALSCSPGLSLIAAGPQARAAIERNHTHAPLYFDLPTCFANMERGQTPFTCAVANVLALRERICGIAERGVATENILHTTRASLFRAAILAFPGTPFILPGIPLSNACTPLVFPDGGVPCAGGDGRMGAQEFYRRLRYDYGLTLCPSGGANADRLLRVGHMGNLEQSHYDALLGAMKEVLA